MPRRTDGATIVRPAQRDVDPAIVSQQLEDEGVSKFIDPCDKPMATRQARLRVRFGHAV